MRSESRSQIIRRAELPSVHSVIVNGIEHGLGTLKELRENEHVRNFMPKDARVSIAWVHLDPEEVLEVHTHPVDSMLLICQGRGASIGEVQGDLSEGDIVLVPNGRPHGFVGKGSEGFWALSMQFDSRGLYEDLTDPWAVFHPKLAAFGKDPLRDLLARNESFRERFSKHRLFTIADRGYLEPEKRRERFLDCLQIWSNYFQKVVHTRVALSERREFLALARLHMRDEQDHNLHLAEGRKDLQQVWDPVLESTSAWFVYKMITLGDVERLVLVHLVLEVAAEAFYQRMAPFVAAIKAKQHFDNHTIVDKSHVAMGVEALERVRFVDWESLSEVQREGWDMISTLLGRIATLVLL